MYTGTINSQYVVFMIKAIQPNAGFSDRGEATPGGVADSFQIIFKT